MPPLLGLAPIVLAPFYLIFTHDSDFEHKEIIPVYSNYEDCNKQAQEIDAIMSGRTSLSLGRMISNTNAHAFCISTGWTLEKTGGAVLGLNQYAGSPPVSKQGAE